MLDAEVVPQKVFLPSVPFWDRGLFNGKEEEDEDL